MELPMKKKGNNWDFPSMRLHTVKIPHICNICGNEIQIGTQAYAKSKLRAHVKCVKEKKEKDKEADQKGGN